ncbi:hypothetical protein G7Y89_g9228 [Cudoniella acicularis]|uniref:Uncharacterized protein n=1 Tax=Cudoniella acicularis TaxID=354080 RepID=A0A8H4RF29_9HELO|nr:hypothetical protein G7Y89_g9228 [Cudoniella acicularis]
MVRDNDEEMFLIKRFTLGSSSQPQPPQSQAVVARDGAGGGGDVNEGLNGESAAEMEDTRDDVEWNEEPQVTQPEDGDNNGLQDPAEDDAQVRKKEKKKKKRKSKSKKDLDQDVEAGEEEVRPRSSSRNHAVEPIPPVSPSRMVVKITNGGVTFGDAIDMDGQNNGADEEELLKKKKKGKRLSRDRKNKSAELEVGEVAELASPPILKDTSKFSNGRVLGSEEQMDEDTEMVDAPKPKRLPRGSNGRFAKGGAANSEDQEAAIDSAPAAGDGEGQGEADGAESTRSSEKAKKSRKSRKSGLEASEAQEPENENIPRGDSTAPVSKSSKVKRKVKAPILQPITSLTVNGFGNRTGSSARSPEEQRQTTQEYFVQASDQLLSEARSNVSPELEDDENAAPKRPSKKALGKRKASNVLAESTKKSKRSRKNKGPDGKDLRIMGFSSSSNHGSRSQSIEQLAKTTEEPYLQTTRDSPMTSPQVLPTILPSSQISRLATHRAPTPTFTPINRPRKPAQSRARTRTRTGAGRAWAEPEPEAAPIPSSATKAKRRLPTGSPGPSKPKSKKTSKQPNGTPKSPNPKKKAQSSQAASASKSRVPNEDIQAMTDAIETYREANNLTQFQVNDLIQKPTNVSSKELWKEVLEAVPDLPRRKVFDTCRRKFHNYAARGSWTKEQDEELKDAYEQFPGKWKQIGQLINRFPEDVRDRWRNYLICGENLQKEVWSKGEESHLRVAVAECVEIVRELRRVTDDARYATLDDESLIDWKLVSEKMDHTRSRLQCINKWKMLKERQDSDVEDPAVNAPIAAATWRLEEAEHQSRAMNASRKLQLLYAIRDTGAGREGKIPWNTVDKALPNSKGQRMGHEMKFKDVLDILIKNFEASAPAEPKEFVDNGAPVREKFRRRSKKSKSELDNSDDSDEEGNGEGPSTMRTRRGPLSEKFIVDDDDEEEEEPAEEVQAASKKRKSKKSREQPIVEEARVPQEEPEEARAPSKKRKSKSKKADEPPVVEEAGNAQEENEPAEEARATSRKQKSKKAGEKPVSEEAGNLEDEGEIAEEARPASRKRKSRKAYEQPVAGEAESVEDSGSRKSSKKSKPTIAEPAVEAHENDETYDKTPVKRKKTKSADEEAQDEDQDIELAPKAKKSGRSKSKKVDPADQNDVSISEEPSSKKKEKKLRERMKKSGESQSQESVVEDQGFAADMSDDLEAVMASLQKGRKMSRMAGGRKSKTNGYLSEEKAIETDEENQEMNAHAPNGNSQAETNGHLSDENAAQNDDNSQEEHQYPSSTNGYQDEMDMDEDEDETFTAPGGPEPEITSESGEEPAQEDVESVDLGAPGTNDSDDEEPEDEDEHTITMNGFHRPALESPEPDTEMQEGDDAEAAEPTSPSPFSESGDNEVWRRTWAGARKPSSSVRLSSDDSSIPFEASREASPEVDRDVSVEL